MWTLYWPTVCPALSPITLYLPAVFLVSTFAQTWSIFWPGFGVQFWSIKKVLHEELWADLDQARNGSPQLPVYLKLFQMSTKFQQQVWNLMLITFFVIVVLDLSQFSTTDVGMSTMRPLTFVTLVVRRSRLSSRQMNVRCKNAARKRWFKNTYTTALYITHDFARNVLTKIGQGRHVTAKRCQQSRDFGRQPR